MHIEASANKLAERRVRMQRSTGALEHTGGTRAPSKSPCACVATNVYALTFLPLASYLWHSYLPVSWDTRKEAASASVAQPPAANTDDTHVSAARAKRRIAGTV